jgi:inward rectifier potassium channel
MAQRKEYEVSEQIEVVGERRPFLRDFYHLFIRASWWGSLAFIACAFVLYNALFAIAYAELGGVANAHSLGDYFYFSVETVGTIGYGEMYPQTSLAHLLVTFESFGSLVMVALMTGLVFAKFSTPRARVQFAEHPVISPYDGVPTLMFRLGNRRDSRLLEATVRVVLMRTERTLEGVTMYRMYDVTLERDRSPALARSWNVLHKIVPGSPFHGATPETLVRDEVELILTLTGIDEISTQMLHAQHSYSHLAIQWGMRHADMLSELSDGRLQLDMRRFHLLVPTVPTEAFPYGKRATG